MRFSAQSVSLWLALGFGLVMLAAFVTFPGFFPPMPPSLSAGQVAAFYAAHTARIRLSMVVFNFCGIMLVPMFTVVVHQMKRMAAASQVFAWGYLSAVVSGATLFAIADLFWLAAAFRPGRDPALIQLLNDLAWITFTAPVGMIVAQNVCLALAVWLDDQPRRVFPRWVAPFSLVIALAMTPAACAAVVTTGPLAWNGLVSFWLRITAYAVFLVVMFAVLRRTVRRQELQEAGAPW